jgi:hypothetical protein
VRDSADLVIEMLADSEAELIDRVVDLMIERNAYRTLAQHAVHALHDMTIERDRLRTSQHRLINEYRPLRVKTLRQPEAA